MNILVIFVFCFILLFNCGSFSALPFNFHIAGEAKARIESQGQASLFKSLDEEQNQLSLHLANLTAKSLLDVDEASSQTGSTKKVVRSTPLTFGELDTLFTPSNQHASRQKRFILQLAIWKLVELFLPSSSVVPKTPITSDQTSKTEGTFDAATEPTGAITDSASQ